MGHGLAMFVFVGGRRAVAFKRRSAGLDGRKSIVGVRDSAERGSAEGLRERRKRLRGLCRHCATSERREGAGRGRGQARCACERGGGREDGRTDGRGR